MQRHQALSPGPMQAEAEADAPTIPIASIMCDARPPIPELGIRTNSNGCRAEGQSIDIFPVLNSPNHLQVLNPNLLTSRPTVWLQVAPIVFHSLFPPSPSRFIFRCYPSSAFLSFPLAFAFAFALALGLDSVLPDDQTGTLLCQVCFRVLCILASTRLHLDIGARTVQAPINTALQER
ncbi:hypothetical protein C8R43DRAFT_1186342 [Mycena crocata]|nr:hypothetical protein C8R43DRAFT_1186342 [Mycena crocata]